MDLLAIAGVHEHRAHSAEGDAQEGHAEDLNAKMLTLIAKAQAVAHLRQVLLGQNVERIDVGKHPACPAERPPRLI